MARVAADLGIFKTVASSEAPVTIAILAEKTGAAPELMSILGNSCCRFLVPMTDRLC